MARFGRSFPVPRRKAYVPGIVIVPGSGSVSATFAAASSGIVTKVPGSGAVTAAFVASAAPIVVVPTSGSVVASFAASGAIALALPTSSVSATFAVSESSIAAFLQASGTIQASCTASAAPVLVTAYVSGAVAASFATGFAPEAFGIPSSVSASFAASATVTAFLGAAGSVVALFSTGVASVPSLHLYSTQPGNPWIVSVESYSFQLQHRIWGGVGLPVANLGTDGDYYFRKDGAAGARMYARASGAWTAIN